MSQPGDTHLEVSAGTDCRSFAPGLHAPPLSTLAQTGWLVRVYMHREGDMYQFGDGLKIGCAAVLCFLGCETQAPNNQLVFHPTTYLESGCV